MKHIKLFETFDRYDFRMYDYNNSTADEMAEIFYQVVADDEASLENISDEDIDIIKNEFAEYLLKEYIITHKEEICKGVYFKSDLQSSIYVLYLGDYVYFVVKKVSGIITTIGIVDGIEEVIIEIKKMI